jgi:hypothetical protein
MIFLKGVLGGLAGVLLVWIALVIIEYRRWAALQTPGQLSSVAGGWNLILQRPLTIVAISTAFGLGFYLSVLWEGYTQARAPHP